MRPAIHSWSVPSQSLTLTVTLSLSLSLSLSPTLTLTLAYTDGKARSGVLFRSYESSVAYRSAARTLPSCFVYLLFKCFVHLQYKRVGCIHALICVRTRVSIRKITDDPTQNTTTGGRSCPSR